MEAANNEVIEEFLKKLVRESDDNRVRLIDNSTIYDEPLVGFADGDDPLFSQYKRIIGDFHMTPRESLEQATRDNTYGAALQAKYGDDHGYGGIGIMPEKVSVISWILPYTKELKATMRHEKTLPPKIWSHARNQGQLFSEIMRDQLVDFLRKKGYAAVGPYNTPFFTRMVTPTERTSNWSERHMAYACGLGTFSLAAGLITPKGISHRCASVVVGLELEPSPRPYASHKANCAFIANGSCGECIARCPAGAISANGLNKEKCFVYQKETLAPLHEPYGVHTAGCAFCQTAVPCESAIPEALLKGNS